MLSEELFLGQGLRLSSEKGEKEDRELKNMRMRIENAGGSLSTSGSS